MANDGSKVTHILVCIVLTPCFCFACSVCFGSFKNLILSGFAKNWSHLVSFKKTTVHINLLEYYFFLRSIFAIIPLFVDLVRYLTFWPMIQTKILTHKVCWLFCMLYMLLWFRSGRISSVEGIWLDVPLTWSLFTLHNFFATARKMIYAACSIQAGRFFIGRNWQCQVKKSSRAFGGGARAPFPNSGW